MQKDVALVAACLVALVSCAPPQPTISIGGRTFTVEVRDTQAGREQGLSGRPSLPAGTGMLFAYDDSAVRSYWMPDMRFSIDLAWIDDERVLGVVTLQPCPAAGPCPRHLSPAPADAVLEVPAGALAGVAQGDQVVIER